MNLDEWRAQKGIEGDLPSGLTVTLRKVHVLDLVASGTIPQTLQPMIEKSLSGVKQTTMTIEELKSYREMVHIVAGACIIGPEGLTVDELDLTDKIAIYQWAMEDTRKLEPFRSKKAQPMESSPASNGLFPAPQRNHRTRTK